MNEGSYFGFRDDFDSLQTVEWTAPGLTVIMDTVGLMTQLIPASALPYYNASVIIGHDIEFKVQAFQSDGVTPFPITGVPINFYGKVNQTDTINLFYKTLAGNPNDIIIVDATNGILNVWVRAQDYASLSVGTTIFLYVDAASGPPGTNPVNIGKWTLSITY